MEVKFNLRDGQTITAEFEDDLGDLEDFSPELLERPTVRLSPPSKRRMGSFWFG